MLWDWHRRGPRVVLIGQGKTLTRINPKTNAVDLRLP